MKAILLNRILLALGFVGLFVAGLLSISHVLHLAPPCSAAKGCEEVLTHKSSQFMGIPVAYFGFGGYAILTGFALMRSILGVSAARWTVPVGVAVAGFGTIVSVYLQYTALITIGAFCPWCFTSAVTMITTFIVYGLYHSHLSSLGELEPAPKGDMKLITTLSVLLVASLSVAVAVTVRSSKSMYDQVKIADTSTLVPSDAHVYGMNDAPITIVEFADLLCPTCQKFTPQVKAFVDSHAGKIRLVYRHDPLERPHPMANVVAFMSEYAAEKGQNFFEFSKAIMSLPESPKTIEEVMTFAKGMNLDVEDMKKRMMDDSDKIYQKVARDRQYARENSINSTPTFLVYIGSESSKVSPVGNAELFELLAEPRFKKILDAPK